MSLRCPDCGEIHEGPRCKPSFPTGYVPRVERPAPVEPPRQVPTGRPTWRLVMDDLIDRFGAETGIARPESALDEAYRHALDTAVALRSAIHARDGR